MMMRKYLLHKDSEDMRDIHYRADVTNAVKLPKLVDLRTQMPPVYNQLDLGSCSANAGVGFREYLLKKDGLYKKLSRLFLYFEERELEGTIKIDAGATLRDCMIVLKNTGVCPETDWPYKVEKFSQTPSAKAHKDAGLYKLIEYHRVVTLNYLKASLSAGKPVIYGFNVYESFESDQVANTGHVPMPNKRTEANLGGHAVLAVGYDDTKKHVITRNSWGAEWGDKGYCYMPYKAFNRTGIVMDMWTGR